MPLNSTIKIYTKNRHWDGERYHYIFANDTQLPQQLQTLAAQHVKEHAVGNENEVALLVGNSYLFSIIASMKKRVKKIYVCDLDPAVLQFIIHLSKVLQHTQNFDEFAYNLRNYLTELQPEDPYFSKKSTIDLIIANLQKEQKNWIGSFFI